MLNSYMVPCRELLSHDSQNIRLLRGLRCNTLEIEQNVADRKRIQGGGAEMNGSGALDFQGRGRQQAVSSLRWVLPVCACR